MCSMLRYRFGVYNKPFGDSAVRGASSVGLHLKGPDGPVHQENGEEGIIHYNLWQKFFVG